MLPRGRTVVGNWESLLRCGKGALRHSASPKKPKSLREVTFSHLRSILQAKRPDQAGFSTQDNGSRGWDLELPGCSTKAYKGIKSFRKCQLYLDAAGWRGFRMCGLDVPRDPAICSCGASTSVHDFDAWNWC